MAFSDDALASIQNSYNQLQSAFLAAANNGATPAQLDQLRQLVSAAGDAYWHAAAQNLADNNPLVTQYKQQLDSVTAKINQSLSSLKDIAQLINLASQAVQLAASIASLAAVA